MDKMTIGDGSTVITCRKLREKKSPDEGFGSSFDDVSTDFFFFFLTNSCYLNLGERDCFLKPLEVSCIDFLNAIVCLGFSIFNKSVWK